VISIDRSKQLGRMLTEGKTLEQSFADLRNSGATIFDCIISVKSLRNCTLVEAKRIVSESETWPDMQIDWKKELGELGD
jgi:hypothetical protein